MSLYGLEDYTSSATSWLNIKDNIADRKSMDDLAYCQSTDFSDSTCCVQNTTSNKPAKSHRDKSKQTNSTKTFISTTVLLETFIFATFYIAPMCIVRVKKIRNNTHSEENKGKLLFDDFFSNW